MKKRERAPFGPGFYANIDGILQYAQTRVCFPCGDTIEACDHGDMDLPREGWHWFESEELASTALGVLAVPERPEKENPNHSRIKKSRLVDH